TVFCEWHNTVLRNGSDEALGIVGIARDLTYERLANLARERLQAIAAAANSAWDLDEILLLIRNALIEVGGFDRAGVWVVDGDEILGSWGTDARGQLRDERGLLQRKDEWGDKIDGLWQGEYKYYTERFEALEPDCG